MQQSFFKSNPFDKRSPFKAQERARRQRLVIAISTGVIPALIPVLLALVITLIFSPSWQILSVLIVVAFMIGLSFIAREAGKRDHITAAGYILLISFLFLIAVNGLLIEGLNVAVAPSYAVVVVMAGMMLGVFGGFVIAILASILWLGVQLGLASTIMPPALPISSTLLIAALVIVVIDFLFTAYMSYLATEDLQQALDDTTYELVRVNRQLADANAEAQRARERIEAILNNSPDPIVLLRGADGGVSNGNPPFYAMFGLNEYTARGLTLVELIDKKQTEDFQHALNKVIAQRQTVSMETVAINKQGEKFDASIALAPIEGEELVKGIVCTIRDVSERVRVEEQVRAALVEKESSLAEREVLLKEIHHRVKNNLQVISSLLRLQSRTLDDAQTRSFFVDSENRVQSMALIHEQLYQANDLARIDFNIYLENLAKHLTNSYDSGEHSITIIIDAEQIFLPIDTAIPCGLIINELISNAFKHAFPNLREGKILVSFKKSSDDQLCVEVKDDGVGMPADVTNNDSNTLGMQLINQLTKQVSGVLAIDRNNGTSFTLRFESPDKT